MFQLTPGEDQNLRCQIGTSSHGGRRYMPYVFTQEGVAMLSSVLSSPRAIQVNIAIMRAFIRLWEMVSSIDELSKKSASSPITTNSPKKTAAKIFLCHVFLKFFVIIFVILDTINLLLLNC